MKKILAIILALTMLMSVQVFANETTSAPTTGEQTTTAQPTPETQPAAGTQTEAAATTTTETANTQAATTAQQGTTADPEQTTAAAAPTQEQTTTAAAPTATQQPGITPDNPLYILDKLFEKIQLTLITDAVKQAELLAKIAQERLAESSAMVDKSNVELAEKALTEYTANLEQAVKLVETAMESGKQVAAVSGTIATANLKDAAVVEKILASIPEQYRAEVKTQIEKLAATAEATNETAQVVEKKDEENGLKQEVTLKLLEEKIKDAALIAKIKEAGLNTRQIVAILSLSEQSKKPLAEVLDLFIKNEMGIGSTAHALGLNTKDALKGINGSFKDTKDTVKKAFKEAMKVIEQDQNSVQLTALVNNSLAGQTAAVPAATTEEAKAVTQELEKVVKEAKAQVAAIAAGAADKKVEKAAEKAVEKVEKAAEKAVEKVEKAAEKARENSDKDETAEEKETVKTEAPGNSANSNGKSDKANKK